MSLAPLEEVGRYLLDHEVASWQLPAEVPVGDPSFTYRIISLLTLLGARDEDDAARALRRVPDLEDANEERRRSLARWVRQLYPGRSPGEWVAQLEPDLLGQALHAETFCRNPGSAARLTDPALTPRQIDRPRPRPVPCVDGALTGTRHCPTRPGAARGVLAWPGLSRPRGDPSPFAEPSSSRGERDPRGSLSR